jgi:hypothetical protein
MLFWLILVLENILITQRFGYDSKKSLFY